MAHYYIDPANGSNSNDGTSESDAFADFRPVNQGGAAELAAGDTVEVFPTAPISATTNGSVFRLLGRGDVGGEPIEVRSATDERFEIDGSGTSDFAVYLNGVENVTFRDAEVYDTDDQGGYAVWTDGHCRLVNCVGHDIGWEVVTADTFYHGGGDVEIRGCVSYNNRASNGDGFTTGAAAGDSARWYDCYSLYDQDGGFDAYPADEEADVRWIRCVVGYAGRNSDGYEPGAADDTPNGTGFKSGGSDGSGGVIHKDCVAYGCTSEGTNPGHGAGFYDNWRCGPSEYYNCTAWNNDKGFVLTEAADPSHHVQNCIAHANGSDVELASNVSEVDNSWTLGIDDPQFRSTDEGTGPIPGAPYDRDFLRLAEGSPCRDAGAGAGAARTSVAFPSYGAPDLGWHQYLDPGQRLPDSVPFVYDGAGWWARTETAHTDEPVDARILHGRPPGLVVEHDGNGGPAAGYYRWSTYRQWTSIDGVSGGSDEEGRDEAGITVDGDVTLWATDAATDADSRLESEHPGHTNEGYVNFRQDDGGYATWTLEVEAPGTYTAEVRYALGDDDREARVHVRDDSAALTFPSTGAWDSWSTLTFPVELSEGEVDLTFETTGEDAGNVDRVELVQSGDERSSAPESGTPNHGYAIPEEGQSDWHVPVNENFAAIDRDVPIVDEASARSEYTPAERAVFIATDTATIYVGDGSEWTVLGSLQ